MNINFCKSVRPGLLLGVLLMTILGTTGLKAATVVNWGGDYISAATVNLQTGTTVDTGATKTYLYSTTNAKSPASGYTAPVGKSGTFYGAFETTNGSGGTATMSAYRIEDNVAGDRIKIWGQSSASAGNTVKGLIFFEQGDYLAAGDAGTVTFDVSSTMSLNVNTFTGNAGARMAVFSGGKWYLSQAVATSTGLFSMSNLSAASWGEWAINSATAPLNAPPTTFATLGSSFTDIDAVGFYFELTRDASSARFEADAFSVNAVVTAVPEPSVVGLGGLAALMGLIYRRRIWTDIVRA